jgi:1,2-diacylglycerol 3-beta-glucosyltransferase
VLAASLELFLVALGLIYFVGTTAAGLRVLRLARRQSHPRRRPRARRAVSKRAPAGRPPSAARAGAARVARLAWHRTITAEQPGHRASVVVDPADSVVYFIVPCLNEERVIEDSVRNLLADPRGIVVVVDDASDDRTGRIAAAIDPQRVIVVRRDLPDARLGKGPALNAGFSRVLQDAAARAIAPSRITVCVMDADGRLSDGALDAVLPLFADPRVGGAQLPVRIRRVRRSVLTLLQDLEFWGVCAVAQLGRIGTGTVSLGGNGQFTRLAALLELGDSPWRARLTEDLDLALALATAGWRLTSTPEAYVSQQGLTNLRALINQRTRWYQGHMQAGRWLSTLWSSRRLSHLSMLELTLYLLVPWALVLPWSLIFNYNLVLMGMWVAGWTPGPGVNADLRERILTVVIWYAVSCIPVWMAGYLYSRQRRRSGPIRALLLGHLLLLGNYITYVACWRAFFRLLVGANSWQKTKRHRERSHRAATGRQRRPRLAGPRAQPAGMPGLAAASRRMVIPAQRPPAMAEMSVRTQPVPRVEPAPRAGPAGAGRSPGSHRAAGGGRTRGAPSERGGSGRGGSHRSGRDQVPAGRSPSASVPG